MSFIKVLYIYIESCKVNVFFAEIAFFTA